MNNNIEKAMFIRGKDVVWKIVDGNAYLVNTQMREPYQLDEVGATIWRLLNGKRDAEEIANKVCEEYDAEVEQVKSDVIDFLTKLSSLALIE